MRVVRNEIAFYAHEWLQNFRNQKALQGNFWMQVAGMFISNGSFFVIWMSFTHTVGDINGWGVLQTFGLLCVSIFTFGMAFVFFGSIGKWPEGIPEGRLDILLTKPKNLYLRLLNQKFTVSAVGDLVQGGLGLLVFLYLSEASWQQTSVLVAMLFIAIFLHVAFFMTCGCCIFFFPQTPHLIRPFFDLLIMPSTQPLSLVQGSLRMIYLFIVPALLISGFPIEAFLEVDVTKIFLAAVITAGWLVLSVYVLKASIRHYESSNLPN